MLYGTACYSLFTPPTRTRQNFLSCPCRRCEHNWKQDKTQIGNWVEWVSECVRFNVPLHKIGHFGDESFQAINCTGTDNQKQSNTTLHMHQKHNRETEKIALTNKTIYTLIWYAFHDLRSGNGVGPILTAPESTRGGNWVETRQNSSKTKLSCRQCEKLL